MKLTDTRTTEQRFRDRFKNARDMLTEGIGNNLRQATRTNPNLNDWGNKAEIVNGLVGMAGNVIGAAGEVLGAGDAVQAIGLGLDYAAGAGLDAADSAEADIRFAQTVIGAENLKNEVVRSIRGFAATHPNTAEGIKAVVNAAATGYGAAKGVGAAKAGKAAVSDNFADAAYARKVAEETAALRRIGKNPKSSVNTQPNTVLYQNAERISTVNPAKGQSANPRNLNEQIFMESVRANPAQGRKLNLSGDPRFPNSAGFQKMEAVHEAPTGGKITIHYQYNSITGKAYDIKVVTREQAPSNPKEPIDSIRKRLK